MRRPEKIHWLSDEGGTQEALASSPSRLTHLLTDANDPRTRGSHPSHASHASHQRGSNRHSPSQTANKRQRRRTPDSRGTFGGEVQRLGVWAPIQRPPKASSPLSQPPSTPASHSSLSACALSLHRTAHTRSLARSAACVCHRRRALSLSRALSSPSPRALPLPYARCLLAPVGRLVCSTHSRAPSNDETRPARSLRSSVQAAANSLLSALSPTTRWLHCGKRLQHYGLCDTTTTYVVVVVVVAVALCACVRVPSMQSLGRSVERRRRYASRVWARDILRAAHANQAPRWRHAMPYAYTTYRVACANCLGSAQSMLLSWLQYPHPMTLSLSLLYLLLSV